MWRVVGSLLENQYFTWDSQLQHSWREHQELKTNNENKTKNSRYSLYYQKTNC